MVVLLSMCQQVVLNRHVPQDYIPFLYLCMDLLKLPRQLCAGWYDRRKHEETWCTNKWPVAPDVTVCFLHSDLTITSYNSKKALQYVKNDYIPVNYTPALYLHCRG